MDAFTTHTGTAAPLRRTNVDTDQIIPAECLKRITPTSFEDGLFVAWRTKEPDFVLNQPQYADASVLVAGPDFGTGFHIWGTFSITKWARASTSPDPALYPISN